MTGPRLNSCEFSYKQGDNQMAITPTSNTQLPETYNPTGKDAFQDLDLDDFLKLLVTELQNQDPMEPMSNAELLNQLSQIREIESNTRLTETLEAVQLGQAMASSGSLIGRYVSGLSTSGERVSGQVEGVSVFDGSPRLHVGGRMLELSQVTEIVAAPTE